MHENVKDKNITKHIISCQIYIFEKMSFSLIEACSFAEQAHAQVGQKRKNATKTDYIVHPLRVVIHLQYAGETDIQVLMAAVLHGKKIL